MQKYQARESVNKSDRAESGKEERGGNQRVVENRPVSANAVNQQRPPDGPTPAWEAARQGQENR